jgi:ATP-binding cassette subfamily B protein
MAKSIEEKPKNFWQTIWRIFSYVSDMKILMFIVIITSIISPLCRTIGTAFFQTAMDNYLVPLSKNYNSVLFKEFINVVLTMSGIFMLGATANVIFNRIVMPRISTRMSFRIRIDLFSKMQSLPIEYFDTHKHGDVMSIYTNDVDNIEKFLQDTVVDVFFNSTAIITSAAMMLYYSWKLSIIVSLMIFVVTIVIKNITLKTRKLFKQQQDELGKLNGFVEEMIEGQKTIKVFNHEKQIKNDFKVLNEKLCEISKNANSYGNILMPVLNNISNINYSFVIMVGMIIVFKGNITIGVALAFFQYARGFIFPIAEMSGNFNITMNAIAGAERIFNYLMKNQK